MNIIVRDFRDAFRKLQNAEIGTQIILVIPRDNGDPLSIDEVKAKLREEGLRRSIEVTESYASLLGNVGDWEYRIVL